MPERKLVLYIAMSLDGYIAGENDDLDFLSSVETEGEDYGYADFNRTVDTIIMGRRTYDKVLSFGIEFPHKNKKCYVLSKSKMGSDENVEYWNSSVSDLLQHIRKSEGKNIYCDGGSKVVFELMKNDLIDRYIISIIPTFVGNGITLFKSGRDRLDLKHVKTKSYPSGLVQLWYDRKRKG